MTILQALKGYYDRRAAQGDAKLPPFGYSWENVSFEVILSLAGDVIDIADCRISDGKKPKPRSTLVPQPPKRAGKNPPPCFLWDKTGYVFGVEPGDKTETGIEIAENSAYRDLFKEYHIQNLAGTKDVGLQAVRAFIDRWDPTGYAGLHHANDMLGANVVFRLDGVVGYIHDRVTAKEIWQSMNVADGSRNGLCLVTGRTTSIARLHPSIKGVRDAQSSGASIISFNLDAFTSYGKEQGSNAPVSDAAAFSYTTAINDMLRKASSNRIQIGDATTVFWAEADDAAQADASESIFSGLMNPPDEADENQKLRNKLRLIEEGRPLATIDPGLSEDTRFYILGLSPNAARISVRFWHETTLGALGERFKEHWQDLRIEHPRPKGPPPSVSACTLMTAPARVNKQGQLNFSFDDVSPLLSGELMRAILTGNRYPGSLLANLVMRLRTDRIVHRTRISLIKAIIVRAMRLDGRLPQEDYLMRSDPDDPNPARRLGRLFALLERAQLSALGDEINSTVKDKFIASAAATPRNVFPGLIKNSHNHTGRLRRGNSDADWIKTADHARNVGRGLEHNIGALWAGFNDGPPVQQTTEEQGLFFVGYYQERFGQKSDQEAGLQSDTDNNREQE